MTFPALPAENEDPWYEKRTAWDEAVQADLEGRLSDASLSATIADEYSIVGTVPPELGWDQTRYPIAPAITDIRNSPYPKGNVGRTARDYIDAVSTCRTAPGVTYYVNEATGLDTNNGTSAATPFQSIRKANQVLNTAAPAAGARVYIAAGEYSSLYGWHNAVGTTTYTSPQFDVSYIATGGRVRVGPWVEFGTPTLDATQTNCYTITQDATNYPVRVLDRYMTDPYGIHPELRRVASAAICNATPGSWYFDSAATKLYVRRSDGQPMTEANTRVLIFKVGFFFQHPVNIYIGGNGATDGSGFDFIGARSAGLTISPTTENSVDPKVAAVEDCTFRYAGGIDSAGVPFDANGTAVSRWYGLAAFFNCQADANNKDGFNFHQSPSTVATYVLTVNCAGYDNGRYAQTSCNGYTLHEKIVAADVAGYYRKGRGGTVHNIADSKCYMLGTVSMDDLGDLVAGGIIPPTAFKAGDLSQLWLERCRPEMPRGTYAYAASGGARIRRKDCAPVPQVDMGPPTSFGTF